jgi:hypothetical protein
MDNEEHGIVKLVSSVRLNRMSADPVFWTALMSCAVD